MTTSASSRTLRDALETTAAHVARVTSLGVLTASIAHEVNQPLSGIIEGYDVTAGPAIRNNKNRMRARRLEP
jgi:C4-dicarboxylate-specific signal transduction histidine kinase